jgi:hypothetical protein
LSDTPPEKPVGNAPAASETPPEKVAKTPAQDGRPAPARKPLPDRWRKAVALAVPVLIVAALIAVFVTRNDEPAALGEDPLIQYCTTAIERDSIRLPDPAATSEEAKNSVPVTAGRMVLLTERMLEVAPEEVQPDLKDQIAAYRDLVRSRDPGGFADSKLLSSLNKTGRADAGTCSMQKVEFAASQFRYRDFPSELNSGRTSLTMNNEANEKHQMVVFRRKPEFGGSFTDILERGRQEEEATRVATGEADPDETDVMSVELTGGEYALTCFVKSGTEEHWEKGEIAEFTVR